MLRFALLAALLLPVSAGAQTPHLGLKGLNEPNEPAELKPNETNFVDSRYKVRFFVPKGWNFARKDGDLTNFSADVRGAGRNMQVRGVATLNYNPYTATTFSGASFYYSVLPVASAAQCEGLTKAEHFKTLNDVTVAGTAFKHGQDNHGMSCTEARDEIFTAMRGKTCLRFDLIVNTFCHASTGAVELQGTALMDVQTRLAKILDTVRLD